MAGILDDDDITLDDLFEEPVIVPEEEPEEKKAEKEKDAQQAAEFAALKAELAELKNQRFAGFSQPATVQQQEDKPKPLKSRIQERLASTGDIADAINMAAEEAFNAGQLSTKAQYVPVAAQAARFAISKFIDDNPMTALVRKEFDKIVNETSDDVLASFDPKGLAHAIEAAADAAEGRVIRKTKNSRGAEPPAYSAGSGGSFGRESNTPAKAKLSKDQIEAYKQIKEVAEASGFTAKEIKEMLGG